MSFSFFYYFTHETNLIYMSKWNSATMQDVKIKYSSAQYIEQL